MKIDNKYINSPVLHKLCENEIFELPWHLCQGLLKS